MEQLSGWSYQPDKCNCDAEFIECVKSKDDALGFSILHMGTGLHHKVGLELSRLHDVMGITYSAQEMVEYMNFVDRDSLLTQGYTVLFGDIHNLNYSMLPKFHFITLFHLGEVYDPETTILDAAQVIRELSDTLYYGGRILAYKGSAAAHISIPIFDEVLDFVEEYKSLRIYKPR